MNMDPLDSINWVDYTAPTVIDVFISGGGHSVREVAWGSSFSTRPIDATETAAIMHTLANYEAVANVSFHVVQDIADADFAFLESNNATDALGYFEIGGGDLRFDGTTYELDGWAVINGNGSGWTSSGVAVGGYGYVTLIHELGHGMGLAHPHDDGGGSETMDGVSSPFDDHGTADLNQGVFTTMSYNDGWQTAPHGASTSNNYGWQGTLMALDIAELQDKYGANTSTNAADDVYTLPDLNASGTYYACIWDTGGTDRIDAGNARDVTIDLRAATLDYAEGGGGRISYAAGIHGGYTIAGGVEIENATGSDGSDLLIGNALANVLHAAGGNDVANGREGDDTIEGGAGRDTINGGAGGDDMRGGSGDDTYFVDNVGDTVTEWANAGDDVVMAALSFTLSANVERLTLSGAANSSGTGNRGANEIAGNAGDNRLDGAGGADTLRGGEGSDTLFDGGGDDLMVGGAGDDIYVLGRRGSLLVEVAGGGVDTVATARSHVLGDHIENLTLTGARDLAGHGNNLDNVILGNGGGNKLSGRNGSDVLRGEDGSDDLVGGARHDTLEGGDGADTLRGGSGRDVLDGGVRNDVLEGGAGKDRYVFTGAWGKDRIVDFDNGSDLCDLQSLRDVNDGHALDVDQLLIVDKPVGARVFLDLDRDGLRDRIDLDGDGMADVAHITLKGVASWDLTGDDFLF